MPGLTIGVVEAGFAVEFAAEEEACAASNDLNGHDVPGVFGDDVGSEEIDFGGSVGDGVSGDAAAGVYVVEAVDELGGSFDLHSPQAR